MAEGVKVEGLKQAVRQLRKMGVAAQDLKEAFFNIGSEVGNEIKRVAPYLGGALAGSVRASKTQNRAEVRAGGAKAVYAGVQNFGWPAHGIEGKHFMERGLENKEEWIEQELEEALGNLITKYFGGNNGL